MRDYFQKEFQREAVFLKENENYLGMSKEEKLRKIKGLVGNFKSKGNSIDITIIILFFYFYYL